jgi:hypothetical protein
MPAPWVGRDPCARRGGFRPCRPDEPGSYIDLDRYVYWLANGEASLVGNERIGETSEP